MAVKCYLCGEPIGAGRAYCQPCLIWSAPEIRAAILEDRPTRQRPVERVEAPPVAVAEVGEAAAPHVNPMQVLHALRSDAEGRTV